MSRKKKGVFDKLEEHANIKPEQVYKVADAVKNADFSDPNTVRQLVRHLSQLANKPLSKEREDKIVESITKNKMPMDMQSLNRFFNK